MGFFDKLKQDLAKNAMDLGKQKMELGTKEIVLDNIPMSLDDLILANSEDFKDPYKIVALSIAVLCLYPVNKELCLAMVNYLKGPKPLSNYEMQFMRDRLQGKEYIAASYFDGATPENEYEPRLPLTIRVRKTSNSEAMLEEGYIQLYVTSGGADSERWIRLRKKESTGQWFLWEYFILSDIRKPKSADPFA